MGAVPQFHSGESARLHRAHRDFPLSTLCRRDHRRQETVANHNQGNGRAARSAMRGGMRALSQPSGPLTSETKRGSQSPRQSNGDTSRSGNDERSSELRSHSSGSTRISRRLKAFPAPFQRFAVGKRDWRGDSHPVLPPATKTAWRPSSKVLCAYPGHHRPSSRP